MISLEDYQEFGVLSNSRANTGSALWRDAGVINTKPEHSTLINQFGNKSKGFNSLTSSDLIHEQTDHNNNTIKTHKFTPSRTDGVTGLTHSLSTRADNPRTELYTKEFVDSIVAAYQKISMPDNPSRWKDCHCLDIKKDSRVKTS